MDTSAVDAVWTAAFLFVVVLGASGNAIVLWIILGKNIKMKA